MTQILETADKLKSCLAKDEIAYLVRVCHDWVVASADQFDYICKNRSLLYGTEYYVSHIGSYTHDVRKGIIKEGDYAGFLKIETVNAEKAYARYQKEISDLYDESIRIV